MKVAIAILATGLCSFLGGYLLRGSRAPGETVAIRWTRVEDGVYADNTDSARELVTWTMRDGRPVAAHRYIIPNTAEELVRWGARQKGEPVEPLRITAHAYGPPSPN
jgi:hypothetical protein